MKLKQVSPLIVEKVNLYEEAEKENEYNDIFTGDCWDIPEAMLEREIDLIAISIIGRVLDIKLKKE